MIEHAADRAPYIDQAQSVNLFLPADVHKRDLHQLHYQAWKRGVKSLYYCRSLSIQRAEKAETAHRPATAAVVPLKTLNGIAAEARAAAARVDYEECLACQ